MLFWKCGRKQNRCKFVLKTCGNCLIKRQQHVSLYAGEVWWVVEGTHHSCIRIWGEVISYKTGSFVGIVLVFIVCCLLFCYFLRSLVVVLLLFTVSYCFGFVYSLLLFCYCLQAYVIFLCFMVIMLLLPLLLFCFVAYIVIVISSFSYCMWDCFRVEKEKLLLVFLSTSIYFLFLVCFCKCNVMWYRRVYPDLSGQVSLSQYFAS